MQLSTGPSGTKQFSSSPVPSLDHCQAQGPSVIWNCKANGTWLNDWEFSCRFSMSNITQGIQNHAEHRRDALLELRFPSNRIFVKWGSYFSANQIIMLFTILSHMLFFSQPFLSLYVYTIWQYVCYHKIYLWSACDLTWKHIKWKKQEDSAYHGCFVVVFYSLSKHISCVGSLWILCASSLWLAWTDVNSQSAQRTDIAWPNHCKSDCIERCLKASFLCGNNTESQMFAVLLSVVSGWSGLA